MRDQNISSPLENGLRLIATRKKFPISVVTLSAEAVQLCVCVIVIHKPDEMLLCLQGKAAAKREEEEETGALPRTEGQCVSF